MTVFHIRPINRCGLMQSRFVHLFKITSLEMYFVYEKLVMLVTDWPLSPVMSPQIHTLPV
jgi:hypothetical protein